MTLKYLSDSVTEKMAKNDYLNTWQSFPTKYDTRILFYIHRYYVAYYCFSTKRHTVLYMLHHVYVCILQGFSNYLFNWYLEKGNIRKLLDCSSRSSLSEAECNNKLTEFLQAHPKIAWMHQIRTGRDYQLYNCHLIFTLSTNTVISTGNECCRLYFIW